MATAVVAEAADALEAQIWVDALRAEGIQAQAFEQSVGGALGGATVLGGARHPVLVPAGSLGRARTVIAELAGGAVLAPYRDRAEAGRSQRRALRTVGTVVVVIVLVAALARAVGG